MRIWRFPDKPGPAGVEFLREARDGEWLAEFKYDGWAMWLEWLPGDVVTFTSRHRKPLPASPALAAATAAWLRERGVPHGALFHGEWMGRRGDVAERIHLWDLLAVEGRELWRTPAIERYELLRETVPADVLGFACTYDYPDLFEASRRPGLEGIVLKRADSPFIGSVRECAINPLWRKVKWRGGEDGRTELVAAGESIVR